MTLETWPSFNICIFLPTTWRVCIFCFSKVTIYNLRNWLLHTDSIESKYKHQSYVICRSNYSLDDFFLICNILPSSHPLGLAHPGWVLCHTCELFWLIWKTTAISTSWVWFFLQDVINSGLGNGFSTGFFSSLTVELFHTNIFPCPTLTFALINNINVTYRWNCR